ncbi:MAG: hypothetical protein FJ104_08985 [Deltaproteobacteria bacterium]|nr:hypothetical protein [Deltaproteobacteria bacterium]
MQVADRVEQRRFVGREFLLYLWFESELFDGTLDAGGREIGLFLGGELTLTLGKERTRISGVRPSMSAEAREALLAGKLPESAGLELTLGERELRCVLHADRLALARLTLPPKDDEAEAPPAAATPPRPPRRKRRRESSPDEDAREAEAELEERHLLIDERMSLAAEVEDVVEALYRRFLALRLGPAWDAAVLPALRAFAAGTPPDADEYLRTLERARDAKPPGRGARRRQRDS